MKIAVPVTSGVVSSHFGHCEIFYFATIENNKIIKEENITPPEHEPGLYPKWVKSQGADLVIAGGMGQKARDLFDQNQVKQVVGAPNVAPKQAIEEYLAGNLQSGSNSCDH